MPDVYATIAEAEEELEGDGADAALKEEGRRRIAEGTFFGHIAYVSAHARRR